MQLTPPSEYRIPTVSLCHCGGLFFCFSRILKECNVTQKLDSTTPQKLAQSNLHRKAVSKRFSKVKNFEFEFPTIFPLHNDIFKFQILKTVFLNSEFHNGPTRYLGHTRDLRRSHKKLLIVPAAPSCTCLPCFLFAYVAEI